MFQRDHAVKKSQDIARTLNRRMDLWESNSFDSLVQEAIQCDRPFQTRRHPRNHDHTKRMFTRLMFQGKIRAAMRWLTDRCKGSVLLPTDLVATNIDGKEISIPVVEALKLKTSSALSTSLFLHPTPSFYSFIRRY